MSQIYFCDTATANTVQITNSLHFFLHAARACKNKTHTQASVRAHSLGLIRCTPGSYRLTLPCYFCYEPIGSCSSNKPLDLTGYPTDPKASQPFGKYAFKNKQGCTESLWHADNSFTASCRSEVREQTAPS